LNKQREGVSTRTKPDGNLPQNRNITCLPWPDKFEKCSSPLRYLSSLYLSSGNLGKSVLSPCR